MWEAEMLPAIKYDVTLSATDMNTHLASLQSQGADIVIIMGYSYNGDVTASQ